MIILDWLHILSFCAYVAIMFVVLSRMQDEEGYDDEEE